MKLSTTTMVSVDGVMQGPDGPDEDRRGGWTTPRGVTIQVYRPSGRPAYATAAADLRHAG